MELNFLPPFTLASRGTRNRSPASQLDCKHAGRKHRLRSKARMSADSSPTRRDFLRLFGATAASAFLPLDSKKTSASVSSRMNEVLFDTKIGSYLPPSRVDSLLQHKIGTRVKRLIAVGETHTNPRCGRVELDVIRALSRLEDGSKLIVGLECFYRQHNPILRRFIEGKISMERMLAETRWKKAWGFDVKQWAGIFRFCRSHRVPMVGLNVPSEFVDLVASQGLEGLPAELRQFLPDMDLHNAQHYERFRRVMDETMEAHALDHKMGDDMLRKWYQAQTLWDEYMAESAALHLEADPSTRMVVVAGSTHIEERNGIPERITKRTAEPAFTIVTRSVPFKGITNMPLIDHPEGSAIADWLWYIPREIDLV